jgi:flagellar export protein FliJ
MRNFPLAVVLRVRRLQEDLARAKVAAARAGAERAHIEHARREARLDGRPAPGSAQASHWRAAVAANLALASDAHAARLAVSVAEEEVAAALDAWSRAAVAHKGIGQLAERHAETVRREQERAEQRAADDRAGVDHRARHRAAAVRRADA